MKTQKMSLANIQGKMSRSEMKNIMAGSGEYCSLLTCFGSCIVYGGACGEVTGGHCGRGASDRRCYCTVVC